MAKQNPSGDFLQFGDLCENEVRVWIVDLDDRTIPPAIVDSLLSVEERDRAACFVFEPDAWHFKLCRVTLRLGLAILLGKPAAAISIRTAERGKPFIEVGGVYFNVSHCRAVGLIAFTRVGEIGADIEAVQPGIESLEIASENFTPGELEWLASSPSPLLQAQRFTHLWTRKEAVLKATGKGIVEGLNSFEVFREGVVSVHSSKFAENEEQVVLKVKDISISESNYAALAGPDCEWIIASICISPGALFEHICRTHPHLV